MVKIKICGLTEIENAVFAAENGSDYIGMVFHPFSKRNIESEQAKKIIRSIKHTSTEVVAVCVEQTAQEIIDICQDLNINIVQLHGNKAREQHYLLPENIHRIYVCNVDKDGNVMMDVDKGLQYCEPERDFVLLDNKTPGSGQVFNWNNVKKPEKFRWFLSGGLNSENVITGIQQLKPYGVDVSSGVESEGKKDNPLIYEFINKSKQ